MKTSLEELLDWFYSKEINIVIASAWDGGWKVEYKSDYGYGNHNPKAEEIEIFGDLVEVRKYLSVKKCEVRFDEDFR